MNYKIDNLQYCKWSRGVFEINREAGLDAVHVTVVYHEDFDEFNSRVDEWNSYFKKNSDLIFLGKSYKDIENAIIESNLGINPQTDGNIIRLPIPKLNINNEGVNQFFKLILPAILAGGIIQINLLVDTIFASLLETGSPTWLYVSDRLIQFPMGIFAIAVGTILLPTLSKFDLSYEKDKFISSIQKGQRFVLFIGIPSLIGLFFCAEDLISTIFYRGAFTESDVISSSYSLMAFSIGLPFFMLMKVLTPAFFARKDTKTPMYVAFTSLILNALLNYYLAFVLDYGHVGIAVGSSIAAIISVCVLEIVLHRNGFIEFKSIFNKFNLNILVSNIFLIVFLYFYTSQIDFMKLNQIERFFNLLFEVTASVIIYFSISRLILKKPLRLLFD